MNIVLSVISISHRMQNNSKGFQGSQASNSNIEFKFKMVCTSVGEPVAHMPQ